VRTTHTLAALMATILLASACTEDAGDAALPNNSDEVCAKVATTNARHLAAETPEGRAFNKAVEDFYEGRKPDGDIGELRRAYFDAWAADVHALAEQGHAAELRTALNGYADSLRQQARSASAQEPAQLASAYEAADNACGGRLGSPDMPTPSTT
jgi:hypothetical protein